MLIIKQLTWNIHLHLLCVKNSKKKYKGELRVKRFVWICSFVLMFLGLEASNVINSEKLIVVVTASYNNKQWLDQNLSSIFNQKEHENYYVMYIDDCSTDETGALVKEWANAHGVSDRITIIRNKERLGAMANQYRAIHLIPDRAIVCIVDGDDWLVPVTVFSYLNNVYSNPKNTWLTYGQFVTWPNGQRGWCCEIPHRYVANNGFRDYVHNLAHLRTFYAGLFKQIQKEDLMFEGKFLEMCADNAAMFPMAEMARGHLQFIPEVLLSWNIANTLNDHKVSKVLQRQLDLKIRSWPRYEKIETPFKDDLQGTIDELKTNVQQAIQEGIICGA